MKIEARHLFFKGKTLAEAATQVGVSKSSAERWSRQEQWVEQRNVLELEMREKFLRENFGTYYKSLNYVVDTAYRILAKGLAERNLIAEGKLPRKRMKVTNRVMLNAAKTYLSLDKVIGDLDTFKRSLRLGL